MEITRYIDDVGRVVIPKEVRELLDIQKGDTVKINVNVETKQIIITKVE